MPDKKRVLFIGNSYTSSNNLPQMIHDLALSAGDTLIYDSYTPGGYTLGQHHNDPITHSKIQDTLGWDIIIFQQQSQILSLLDEGVVHTETWYSNILGQSLGTAISNNPCIHPMIFMTWGRENGDPVLCPTNPPSCTYETMDDRIFLRTMEWASFYPGGFESAMISPVGKVWRNIRNSFPSIELYQSDGSHPSLEGSYAAACTFYSAIFRKALC